MAKRGFSSSKNPPPSARFKAEMPVKPDDLSEYEAKMWDVYCPMFFDAGVLDESNCELLRSLCMWMEVQHDFKSELDRLYTNPKTGEKKKLLLYKTKAGGMQLSAAMRGLEKATTQVTRLLDYFGATPKSRDRVALHAERPKPIVKTETPTLPQTMTAIEPVISGDDIMAELAADAQAAMDKLAAEKLK